MAEHLSIFPFEPPVEAGRSAVESLSAGPPLRSSASLRKRLEHLRPAQFSPNQRLVATALREALSLAKSARELPTSGSEPRVLTIASAYLDAVGGNFSESSLLLFIDGFQEREQLRMNELWALKPALVFVLLERLADSSGNSLHLIDGLRRIGESDWKTAFEAMNIVDTVLVRDPEGAYSRMDFESRELYRTVVSDLATHSGASELEVAEAALGFAERASAGLDTNRRTRRRCHVGYYLVDDGLTALRERVGYWPSSEGRIRDFVLTHPTYFYLLGIEILTLVIAYTMLSGLERLTPVFAGFFLLLLPATQAAVDFMNNLAGSLVSPRQLPKLDFSRGIPPEYPTLVAVPTLLIGDDQVRGLVTDLEIRYLANHGPNLYFALITDWPDSDRPVDDKEHLVDLCSQLIQDLNARYSRDGRAPFLMLHRHRVYNASEGCWMGWERKRGKLLDLNQLLRGGFDSFPVKTGDLSILPVIRYVITLDSDTQLPRGSAQRLIGALAHPLNRAVVDPATNMVTEGYGILQPRIGVSVDSASSSFLANLYSGQSGFDIYTRAVSDVYQDLFGEGIFTGKGIYDVDAFRKTVENRFPDNALLSHDLIEGTFARAALVSDIELIDDYPSHFSAYNKRKHRWMRGDWQILRWIFARVPNRSGERADNPVSLISRWKIVDNLRRSLFEPATLLLLLSGWFYLPGSPIFWTLATLAMLLMPAASGLLFSAIRAPWGGSGFGAWLRNTFADFFRDLLLFLLHLTFLLHDALLALDAVVRSLARVFVTRRRLLEWETAAQAEERRRGKGAAAKYLGWTPLLALVAGTALWFVRPEAMPIAFPILGLWVLSPLLAYWLNLPPAATEKKPAARDARLLRSWALDTWRYFAEFSTADTHWLIPDNVREDGAIANRLSPTNLGFLLNARVAAVHLGYLTLPEFAAQTAQTLDAMRRLERVRGHFVNWYDTASLCALEPRFVSTVDSGNLAACLWTLKQACLAFADKPPDEAAIARGLADYERRRSDSWAVGELAVRRQRADEWRASGLTPELAAELLRLAGVADQFAAEMDFGFLYDRRKKVATVGYSDSTGRSESSTYDLLASEARIAAFVAIAKSEFPQESWFHLGRLHTLVRGERVLVSWTGTMFEYLMPVLWMRRYANTVIEKSMQAAVRLQRSSSARWRGIWGISESACLGWSAGEYGYHAFGLPELAMKRPDPSPLVLSPYSSFLALLIDPNAAMANLRRMQAFGWTGRYGFYESVEFSCGAPEAVRCWMAHHQGMSLLALVNALFDFPFQRYFHAEPHVLATELLLHERLPSAMTVD